MKFNNLYDSYMNESKDIPKYLYHATYEELLDSIKKNGLGNSKRKNWSDSKQGVVYLATSKDVAESYAEASEEVPEEWLDEIVILKIDTTGLDRDKFLDDSNVRNETSDTLEYHGVIDFSNIQIV